MKLENKKLILFDLDGTLVDSIPDLVVSVNHMLNEIGREPFDDETVRTWVGNGVQVLVQRALSGDVNIDENIDKAFFENSLKIFMEFYEKNVCIKTTIYDNVKDTLEALHGRGYTLAVVTNKPYAFVEPILKKLKINRVFKMIVGGDSLEKKKPDPLQLVHVCEKLGFTIKQSVMVGDSKNDILAAKSAGMQSIGVTYGYNYGEDISLYKPDIVIDNFAELENHLKD
jgi:phosphoglycolate phosphatase